MSRLAEIERDEKSRREDRIFNLAWNLFWDDAAKTKNENHELVAAGMAVFCDGVFSLTKSASNKVYRFYVDKFSPKKACS